MAFRGLLESGRPFDPNDPFRGGAEKSVPGLLGVGGRYGFFDPAGSQAFKADARRRLLAQGRGRRRRSDILGRLMGLDPMQQRQYLLDTEQDIAGDTAGGLMDIDVGEHESARDFYRGLLDRQLELEIERRKERNKQRMAESQQRADLIGGGMQLIGGRLLR